MTSDSGPQKIAILGGGVAAVAAAFELSRPELAGRYEITIFQLGWRLGGKGASGRGRFSRIEEHGLHVWMGWYENAFRLMRECYEELGRPVGSPLARWDDAFKKASWVALEDVHEGNWSPWLAFFPENDRIPGVTDAFDGPLSLWWAVEQGIKLIITLARSIVDAQGPEGPAPPIGSPIRIRPLGAVPLGTGVSLRPAGMLGSARPPNGRKRGREGFPANFFRLQLLSLAAALGILQALDPEPRHRTKAHERAVLGLVETFAASVRANVASRVVSDPSARRTYQMIDLLLAHITGIIRFGLLSHPDPLATIDNYEYAQWLRLNGATGEALETALLRGYYDLAFAYEHGDSQTPRISAAVALQTQLQFWFRYKGALMWKMQAGMGDVVFAPFYEVLKQRGVKFRFFHRVDSLCLSDDKRSVAAVEIASQVRLKGETQQPEREYQPLVMVEGLPCWPAEPCYDQIENGEVLARHCRERDETLESFWCTWQPADTLRLEAGRDFDRLIFAISLGSVPYMCRELVEASPRWAAMVEHVATVQTEALQLWVKPAVAASGWAEPFVTVGGYVEPFDTWADMSQLIERESWPAGDRPGSIHYFCNTMAGPDQAPPPDQTEFPHAQSRRVKEQAVRFLQEEVDRILPNLVWRYPNEFRWELLCGAGDAQGEARFDSQFWRANCDPSERYVLSLPGTARYRIKPGETGFRNLVIAGDWTDCRINAGCVEAAVVSGMLAANAVSGRPSLEEISGYLREWD